VAVGLHEIRETRILSNLLYHVSTTCSRAFGLEFLEDVCDLDGEMLLGDFNGEMVLGDLEGEPEGFLLGLADVG